MSKPIIAFLACALFATAVRGQEPAAPELPSFERAAASLDEELSASLAELARLRAQMAAEEVPLSRELSALEAELSAARNEYQNASRLLETRTLDLGSLQTRIKTLEEESRYLSNLMGDYMREFDASLHIAERARYGAALEAAQLAADDTSLADQEVLAAQLDLLPLSFERLERAIGGERFEGVALDADAVLQRGTFLLLGPTAFFRSTDGALVGTVEQRVNSLEPTAYAYAQPADSAAAAQVMTGASGSLPIDPTLGNARKIEATSETLLEHVQKGGPVMVPIFALAALAFLVALFKWVSLSLVRTPSRKKLDALLEAVEQRDEEAACERVTRIKGPVGRMLRAGVEHLREPRELIEEVMYEHLLTTRLKLQRMLPFIAICAASAPLLGLLGTVTGIINTFKMITVFGSGDVKSLSGGISEALITTKFGLIVAIPSLLLHALLSRKARGVVGCMETAAVTFANRVSKARLEEGDGAQLGTEPGERPGHDPEWIREQVNQALQELLEERVAQSIRQRELTPQPAPPRGADQASTHDKDASVLVPQPAKRE